MSYKPVDTAIVMVVGPLVDDTDFKSLEESVAYNAAGMDVSLIVEKTDGTSTVTAITLTSGGASDWTHKDGGYYEVEVTAAQNAEEGVAFLRGVCTGVLPFESAHYGIVPTHIYDSLVKGTDKQEVDAVQLSNSAQSLLDLKDFADAGYNPTTNKVTGVLLTDTCTTNTDMVGTANAALAATALTDVTWTDAKAAFIDASIAGLNNISVANIIAGITDGSLDLQEMMRIIVAATAGKSSGGGTVTLVFRDSADSKDRITATVDANGNRTAMTLDGA